MPVPSLEKTWRFNVNRKRATGSNLPWHQGLLFDIVQALTTNDGNWDIVPTTLWSVDHSCDSITAGTPGDGIDRWVTSSNLVWNTPPSNHAWTVLQAPQMQVCIDLDGGSTSPESIAAFMAPNSDFIGGTTGARPTAATGTPSEITRGEAPGDWAGDETSTGENIGWHLMMSDDGEEVRIFFHRNNICFAVWMFGVLADTTAGVGSLNQWATIWSGQVDDGLGSVDEVLRFEQNHGLFNFNIGQHRVSIATGNLGRFVFLNGSWSTSNSTIWEIASLAGRSDELNDEDVFGQIFVWDSDTSGLRGPKGRVKDMWISKNYRQVGDTFPADGSRQFHQIGANCVVPWNGTIPENQF